jgi:hypothetical protein
MIVTELFARLGVQLERASFRQAEGAISGLGKAMGSIGATLAGFFAANKFGQFIGDITHMGAALHDQSERLGITTAALQELGLAAQLAGADSSSLETGLKLLGRNAQQAASGSSEMAKAFRSNGISLKGANGQMKTADQLLEDVADAMHKTDDPTKRTAIAMKLLGRSGAQLIPLLKDGAAGLRAARGEAQALGGGLSEELIKAADEFDDNLTRLNFSLLSLKSIIGAPILNGLDNMARKLIALNMQIKHWLETNQFFQYALKISIVLLGAFAAQAIYTARATIAAWAKAAAPFVLIATAVILLAAALDEVYQSLTGGKSLLVKFLQQMKGFSEADQIVRSMAEGVQSLTAAFRDLWELMKAVITADWDKVSQVFSGWGDDLKAAADALKFTIKGEDTPAAKTVGRGMNAALDEGQGSIPQVSVRGMAGAQRSALVPGSAQFDAVSGEVSRANRAAIASPSLFMPQASISAPAQQAGPSVTVGGASVTVHARTGADAREIVREAEKAARRINEQQAKDVEASLAPRQSLRDMSNISEVE